MVKSFDKAAPRLLPTLRAATSAGLLVRICRIGQVELRYGFTKSFEIPFARRAHRKTSPKITFWKFAAHSRVCSGTPTLQDCGVEGSTIANRSLDDTSMPRMSRSPSGSEPAYRLMEV